jgi:hypothetical protein
LILEKSIFLLERRKRFQKSFKVFQKTCWTWRFFMSVWFWVFFSAMFQRDSKMLECSKKIQLISHTSLKEDKSPLNNHFHNKIMSSSSSFWSFSKIKGTLLNEISDLISSKRWNMLMNFTLFSIKQSHKVPLNSWKRFLHLKFKGNSKGSLNFQEMANSFE